MLSLSASVNAPNQVLPLVLPAAFTHTMPLSAAHLTVFSGHGSAPHNRQTDRGDQPDDHNHRQTPALQTAPMP